MDSWSDIITISIVLMNLMLLFSSRISTCIQIAAVQGALIAFLPFIADLSSLSPGTIIFSSASVALKGFVFPRLLFRAQREANIRKDVEPIGGYPLSLAAGVAMFIVSCWISGRLPYTHPVFSQWSVAVSLSMFFTGVFIIVSRVKALTQVIGYLVLENSIYLFGIALLVKQPLLVELAILLDIFVAVFVMGIAIFHISREFDHIDTQNLSELKDWMVLKEGL